LASQPKELVIGGFHVTRWYRWGVAGNI